MSDDSPSVNHKARLVIQGYQQILGIITMNPLRLFKVYQILHILAYNRCQKFGGLLNRLKNRLSAW